MALSLSLLLAALFAQTSAPQSAAGKPAAAPSAAAAAERAAVAAEKAAAAIEPAVAAAVKAAEAAALAAQAAQKAAEAAQHSAEAMEKAATAHAAETKAPAAAAGPAAPPAAAAPAGPPPVAWTGTVALGLIALTGNSQTITFSTNLALERKSEHWIWGFKGYGAYGQNTVPATTSAAGTVAATSTVTALAAGVQARGDRRFNEALSLYLLGGTDTDHLKSIENRPFVELGVSLIWFDEKVGDLQKASFKTDLGFRYGHEYRFQYYGENAPMGLPGVNVVAPRLGAAYRYAINKDIIFTEDAGALGNVVDQARLILTSVSKLSSRLTEKVALGVSFAVQYDSAPPPMKQNTDTALTVGLEIGL